MQNNVRLGKVLAQGLVAITLIASVVGQVFSVAAAPAKPSYEYYVAGNPGDVTTTTSGGLLLMGGGTDVDAGFQWMIGKSGGGDFVVIRATIS